VTPKWKPPVDRGKEFSERSAEAEAFVRAAIKLISGAKTSEERNEAERLGVEIAVQLSLLFQGGEPTEGVNILRHARAAFETDTVKRRRYWCCRAIADWAQRLTTATGAHREQVVIGCVRELVLHDEAFAELSNALPQLETKLQAFKVNAGGQHGAKSAERILAEIIVEDVSALDLSERDDEDAEDAIERIRVVLARDVASSRPT
jgi:hypothetical protein